MVGAREDWEAEAVVTGEVATAGAVATAAAVRAAPKEATGREEVVRVVAGLESAVAVV